MMNAIADRLLRLFVPKATALAACQERTYKYTICFGGVLYVKTCKVYPDCKESCSQVLLGNC